MSLEDQRGITFFVFKSLPNNSYGDDYYAVIEDETLAYLILTYGIVEPATVSLPPRKYAFAKKRKLPGFPGYGK